MVKQKTIKYINQEKIIEQIKNYKVVSFDIFDTLVKRDCAEGKKLFDMMELGMSQKYLWVKGFSDKRKDAEHRAREKSSKEEITFEEIYDELRKYYSTEQIDILRNSEINYEIELCQVNQHMLQVYNYCLFSNKTIIFTSDMYLPYNVIETILLKVGLKGYKKLYLSSQLYLTKQTGHIYKYIINNLQISHKDIIHIGDNKKSDVLMPMRYGIKSIYIPHILYSNLIYNADSFINKEHVSDYRAICSFIDNRILHGNIKDDEYFWRAGYEMEGPLLMGFTKWLRDEFEKQNIKKIFFLSRDGQIMEKAYKYIFGENDEIKYMYASRRALIVPTLWMCSTLEEMVSTMFFPRIGSIGSFLKKIGLEHTNYITIAEKYGYNLKNNYNYIKLFEEKNFRNFYNEIKQDIYDNSKAEYEIIVKYLQQIDFNGKLAIVDIGWHGNMQKALVKICKLAGISVDITGFYIGLNTRVDLKKQNIKAHGFLFQKGFNEEYFERQRTFTSIFEMMFTADHGSVKKFIFDGYVVNPVLENFEYGDKELKKEFLVIKNIQKGALDFIKDIIEQPKFLINWSAVAVFQNMVVLGNAPNNKASYMFGNIKHLGDRLNYIANPKNIMFYITHPMNLRKDLAYNPWKIGFFKRLCKINFPYYEVYMVMRMIYLKLKTKV